MTQGKIKYQMSFTACEYSKENRDEHRKIEKENEELDNLYTNYESHSCYCGCPPTSKHNLQANTAKPRKHKSSLRKP